MAKQNPYTFELKIEQRGRDLVLQYNDGRGWEDFPKDRDLEVDIPDAQIVDDGPGGPQRVRVEIEDSRDFAAHATSGVVGGGAFNWPRGPDRCFAMFGLPAVAGGRVTERFVVTAVHKTDSPPVIVNVDPGITWIRR